MPLLVSDESANLGGKELIGSKSGLGEPGELGRAWESLGEVVGESRRIANAIFIV